MDEPRRIDRFDTPRVRLQRMASQLASMKVVIDESASALIDVPVEQRLTFAKQLGEARSWIGYAEDNIAKAAELLPATAQTTNEGSPHAG